MAVNLQVLFAMATINSKLVCSINQIVVSTSLLLAVTPFVTMPSVSVISFWPIEFKSSREQFRECIFFFPRADPHETRRKRSVHISWRHGPFWRTDIAFDGAAWSRRVTEQQVKKMDTPLWASSTDNGNASTKTNPVYVMLLQSGSKGTERILATWDSFLIRCTIFF